MMTPVVIMALVWRPSLLTAIARSSFLSNTSVAMVMGLPSEPGAQRPGASKAPLAKSMVVAAGVVRSVISWSGAAIGPGRGPGARGPPLPRGEPCQRVGVVVHVRRRAALEDELVRWRRPGGEGSGWRGGLGGLGACLAAWV